MKPWPITISLPTGLVIGGVTTWAVQWARKLAETEREVRLIVHEPFEEHDELTPDAAGLPPAVRVVRAPNLKDPLAWQRNVELYRGQLPTILVPNVLAESYALAAVLTAVFPERLRVVGWCHSDNPYDYTYLSYYEPIIQRYVAVSQRCLGQLRSRLPTRAAQMDHLPYGVHVPPETPRPALRGRPIRLVYAGRMEQFNKRVFDLVKLGTLLDRRGIWFELRLVGDGPQVAELRERIAAATAQLANPANTIRWEPPVPHEAMPAVWSWADASLLASGYEGFSISMIESMACGCIPVVSRVQSGVADIVRERRNGLTFPVDDLETAADCVQWLAQHPAELPAMSRAARQAADETSGYERFAARALAIMDEAARGPARAWPSSRPAHMNTAGAPTGAAADHDAAERLRRMLQAVAEADAGPVAIYGAGNHTRALGAVLAESPVDIVAILDDDRSLIGRRLWGWPIVAAPDASATGARAVVISSWMHEAAIWERRRGFEQHGLRVFRLYGDADGSGETVSERQALAPARVEAEVEAADKPLAEAAALDRL
jgi:glycosyltransferase involved in cell wall biosynthesis